MFVTLMPCLYVLLCGPKIRNKDSCILYLVNAIGKKSNQTSVSDADRDLPILGSTDKAGNSENLVSGIIRLPSVEISLSASETEIRFYFS